MNKIGWVYLMVLFLVILILAACGGAKSTPIPVEKSASFDDRPDPPGEYTSMKAMMVSDVDIEEGRRLFVTNCQSCHGETGMADGPVASSLDPKPQPLANTQAELSDAYLYWRIAEGGQMDPFRSAMPAWKTILKDKQIWQIIGYIREFKS